MKTLSGWKGMNSKSEIQRYLERLIDEFLDKRLKDLTDILPELFCREEPYYGCVIDSLSYAISFGDAQDLGILPVGLTLDIGDIILSLDTSGGYSGGELLNIVITNPKDVEITLEDRDLILTKLKDATLRDFLRMSYAFAWKLERNHYSRMAGTTSNETMTIGDLMRNFLNVEVVPEPDVAMVIKKHFDMLDNVRYEVGVIRVPLDVRVNESPENITLTDVLDAFKFAFAPLFK